MGHPTRKVARASHSVFVAFISSGKDPNHDERVTLKEQLVFYYMRRSLEVFKQLMLLLIIILLHKILDRQGFLSFD